MTVGWYGCRHLTLLPTAPVICCEVDFFASISRGALEVPAESIGADVHLLDLAAVAGSTFHLANLASDQLLSD